MLRAFLAIDPPPTLRPCLQQVLDHLKASGAQVKWVPVGNIHLTLKFFGNITAAQAEAIAQAAAPLAAAQPPFTLTLTSPGAFPHPNNPRVIWVGVGGQLDVLTSFFHQLETHFAHLGFPPEGRTFAPHLTLGRRRSPLGRQELTRRLALFPPLNCPAFQVNNIVLFQSILSPQGATYTPLHIIPLGKAND